MTSLGGGQRGALPHGAGLPRGRRGGNHFEQPVRLCRCHAGLEQPLLCRRHQLGHELGSSKRPYLISMPSWPAQLSGQALLGGPIETMIGTLERQCVGPLLVLARQPQGQPDQESGVSQHVNDGRAGGQGPHLDPQMPAQCGVVDGTVPAPHGALVQPELIQGWRRPPGAAGPEAPVAEHRQQRRVQPDALGEQIQRPASQPARSQCCAGQPAAGLGALAIVNRLLDHLYTCRDKLSGTDVFYANTAIKKADVAPRGAWIAGGIESSFPIAHSRVAVSPVHFATTQNEDGSGSVFVAAVDRISGMEWRVAYTLRPGSAVLQQQVWLYNPGPVRHTYQWWTNAAIRLSDNGLRFTYPMWVTAPHGGGVLDSWPVDIAGVDRTRTANYPDNLGLFAYGSREPFFAEYNPQSRTGVARWADPQEVPGKKVWVYGKADTGYKDSLSDDHSGYAEIQSGLMTTQDMMQFLEPQQSRSFTELWIPSRNTGGISRATPAAVLFLERTPEAGGAVKAAIDLNVTSLLPHASLTVTKGGQTVYQQTADLDPATAFHAETAPADPAGKFRFELKDASGQVLLAHQEGDYDAVTPSEVKIGASLPVAAGKRGPEEPALASAEYYELVRVYGRAAIQYDAALAARPQSLASRKAAGRFSVVLHQFAEAARILAPLERENPTDAETKYY